MTPWRKKERKMATQAEIKAYLEKHVQTPRCAEWRQVLRQLSKDELEQLIDATEAEADRAREAEQRDLDKDTLESYAAYVEASRQLEWAQVTVARQIIAARKETEK
jgi:hypothetical protein